MNAAPTPTAATGAAPELGVVEVEAAAADAELEVDRAEEAAADALEGARAPAEAKNSEAGRFLPISSNRREREDCQ